MDLARLREHYSETGFSESEAADDPMTQFEEWFGAWLATAPYDASACVVATTDNDGWPSARAVLLKGFDERGFVFHTNRRSAKGSDLELSGRAALCFLWHPVERQVRVVGSAEHLPDHESDAYFASRPRGSQIAACASPQSQPLADRGELERLVAQTEARYEGATVPRPQHWGGYLVRPHLVEFWQGRRSRLHDRLRFSRDDSTAAGWRLERLAP
ncbi:MAG: pyridoxamine 5'-phosphate oxidase [Acidimicrobiaceae bacterium]|nr:pyridoxamine 5'-phosphate oxidase [Acidimicrobiaceae bacterium]MCY4280219.1 pyridoxamine 5'-phosphate oxidase [Acidimicrobiaceae bacterium]MCY4293599.1 pyridoxamine 5'-phosphate oxidase [Acidimicrobiaceae bacterium]